MAASNATMQDSLAATSFGRLMTRVLMEISIMGRVLFFVLAGLALMLADSVFSGVVLNAGIAKNPTLVTTVVAIAMGVGLTGITAAGFHMLRQGWKLGVLGFVLLAIFMPIDVGIDSRLPILWLYDLATMLSGGFFPPEITFWWALDTLGTIAVSVGGDFGVVLLLLALRNEFPDAIPVQPTPQPVT